MSIDETYFKSLSLADKKSLFAASSSSISAIIDTLKPRYIYSSILDIHYKPLPYQSAPNTHITRFIALGSLPGSYKQADSKQVYI